MNKAELHDMTTYIREHKAGQEVNWADGSEPDNGGS